MVAFRKLFPVLAVGALSAASAFAQVTTNSTALVCQANSGVPPVVRAEGLTELLGDLVINCTGGNPAQTVTTNIQVFLNTNVTSRLSSDNTYDALLMIDEPGAQRLDVNGNPGVATPFCPSFNSSIVPTTCNPTNASQTNQQNTFNVFRGQRPNVSADNSIVWTGIPIVPPGSNHVRTIRITNVRGNASSIGATSSGLPNQIIAFISSFPQGTLPIDNPQQTVGYVQQGLLFDTRNCANSGGPSSSRAAFQCQSRNADRYNTPTSGSLPSNSGTSDQSVIALRFREGFQTAFKTRIQPGQTNSSPGQVFNAESGFVNTLGLNDTIGVADTGTRLMARFTNVPSNVRIFVSNQAVSSGTQNQLSSASAAAVLVTTDPSGASNTGTSATSAPPSAPPAAITVNCSGITYSQTSSGANAVEVPITNGSGQAVWEVTAADQSNLDTLIFYAAYAYVANANAGQPGLGTTQVTGTFAPLYTATNAGTANFAPALIPRFVAGSATAQNWFAISSCSTNLLFPFVTNQAGFDTGIAIANTSQDPFSSSNQNAGTCTMNYYGTLPNNAPLTTTSETTTSAVAAGSTLTMVLSSGGGYGLKGNPNMQGYIIAQCNFRFAHGFAFITDGPIGQARVAEGYLAIVLDGANSVRGQTNGEEQGH